MRYGNQIETDGMNFKIPKSPGKTSTNERLYQLSKQKQIKRLQLYQKYNKDQNIDITKLSEHLCQSMQVQADRH